MEELAVTSLSDLDKLSKAYFDLETKPQTYMIRLASNFRSASLAMPQGTDGELSSWALIKCHTAWLWHSSQTDAASAIRYYNNLIGYFYNRAMYHNTTLKERAMDATNNNEYWTSIGGTNANKQDMVQKALTVTTMFKGSGNDHAEEALWNERLAHLLSH
ncbi:hypothetical protein ETB97_005328 [Aspergillus alliaceus]|uniref:Uncharacterized protein n=1 Tax=Petromyces alliaceus TaxID=209559 RepID=A0A8H6AB01_PETAA|nr:hypothetical protein ETB97_005328 [Aspergillus burnettii]